MARKVVTPHVVILTASLVSSSYEAALRSRLVNADVPARKSITFYDDEEMTETVIGYLERPEDGQLCVIDVSRVKYPLRNNSCILFDALFDQEALGEFNNFQMKGFRQGANPTAMTPSPLKRHLMRSFGLRTLQEYVQKFADDSKLYVEDGVRSKQNNISLHCLVYLRRSDVDQASGLQLSVQN
ncbi:hypothetical protein FOL46_005801 [Perkinsus olseni]|uniref:Uncharacterized protein n=1 Tax=Perkinsus olseni TaxID=32597 RepID=A0A7J6MRZ2_PEROL|nr:hypothetical protein FOL46_005801 [Perkinsus olseni]